jgi:hypothetical protein
MNRLDTIATRQRKRLATLALFALLAATAAALLTSSVAMVIFR